MADQNLYVEPVCIGPVAQVAPALTPPGTLAASATYQTGVLPANGYKSISFGAKLSQAGSISLQRYLDSAGTIPIGAAVTATLSANTPNWVNINDGAAFTYFQVTVTNTSGSTATLSNVGCQISAA